MSEKNEVIKTETQVVPQMPGFLSGLMNNEKLDKKMLNVLLDAAEAVKHKRGIGEIPDHRNRLKAAEIYAKTLILLYLREQKKEMPQDQEKLDKLIEGIAKLSAGKSKEFTDNKADNNP